MSTPTFLACARAVDHAKFKTTKIYSQGISVNYSKICTNENFPLYGSMGVGDEKLISIVALQCLSIDG